MQYPADYKEEMYQLAVHLILSEKRNRGIQTASASFLQRCLKYQPQKKDYYVSYSYDGAHNALERMQREGIISGGPLRKILRSRAPMAMTSRIKRQLKRIQSEMERRQEPTKRLASAFRAWLEKNIEGGYDANSDLKKNGYHFTSKCEGHDIYFYELFYNGVKITETHINVNELMEEEAEKSA